MGTLMLLDSKRIIHIRDKRGLGVVLFKGELGELFNLCSTTDHFDCIKWDEVKIFLEG